MSEETSLPCNTTMTHGEKLKYEENIKERLAGWEKEPPKNINEMKKFYDEWADSYEQEKVSANYQAPRHIAEYFHKYASQLGLPKDCDILDVAAGTGWAGEQLKRAGYTHVDGLEPCEKMFAHAREKHVYRKYIVAAAGGDDPMPVPDASYDGAVIAGSLPHIGATGLEDMIRVLKPGGLFVCAGKVNYIDKNARWMMPTLHKLAQKGAIKKLEIDIPPEFYYMDFTALVVVYQKL